MDPRINIPSGLSLEYAAKISVPVAPVHAAPRPSSQRETELLYGDQFEVYSVKRGWAWGQAAKWSESFSFSGYVGYVKLKHLSRDISPISHVVQTLDAPVFKKPDIKSQIVSMLPLAAKLSASRDGNFFSTDFGYIHSQHVRSLTDTPAIQDYVSVAEHHMGRPYIWGGVSSRGLDCSGLVLSSLRATGRDFPRDSDFQSKEGNPITSTNDLKRGDLVFWKGHVGIMQSSTDLLHANAYHMTVASEPLSEAIERISKTGGGDITAMRRIISD